MLLVEYRDLADTQFSDGMFGEWRISRDVTITKVVKVDQDYINQNKISANDVFDVPCNVGDVVYVLRVTYSTGDTFGHSSGNTKILMISTHKSIAASNMCDFKDQIDQQYIMLKKQTENGVELFRCSNPVYGYFEQLEDISIEKHVVV